jgi:hypothetical protein
VIAVISSPLQQNHNERLILCHFVSPFFDGLAHGIVNTCIAGLIDPRVTVVAFRSVTDFVFNGFSHQDVHLSPSLISVPFALHRPGVPATAFHGRVPDILLPGLAFQKLRLSLTVS